MRNALFVCRRPLTLGAVATAFAVAAAGGGVSAAASRSHVHGKVQIVGTNSGVVGGGNGGTIIVTGVIGDSGTSGPVTKAGTPDANGSYAKLTLTHGTIVINMTKLDAKVSKKFRSAVINRKTCSTAVTASATLPVVSGSGRYKGISGKVHITLSTGLVLPRYTSGAHSGKCDESSSAVPTASLQTVDGTGTVTFG